MTLLIPGVYLTTWIILYRQQLSGDDKPWYLFSPTSKHTLIHLNSVSGNFRIWFIYDEHVHNFQNYSGFQTCKFCWLYIYIWVLCHSIHIKDSWPLQQMHHRVGSVGVKASGWFIEKEYGGRGDQFHCNVSPLAFSSWDTSCELGPHLAQSGQQHTYVRNTSNALISKNNWQEIK